MLAVLPLLLTLAHTGNGLVRRVDSSGAIRRVATSAFEVHVDACGCDLRELECLPTPACMQSFRSNAQSRIARGVALRNTLKANATFTLEEANLWYPIGKGLQRLTIDLWKLWAQSNRLPKQFGDVLVFGKYPDHNQYAYCREHQLQGAHCVWNDFASSEDLGDLERKALEQSVSQPSPETFTMFGKFRNMASSRTNFLQEAVGATWHGHTADYFLRSFAHLLRIAFNRQQSMQKLYDELVTTVTPSGKTDSRALRVALHIRRSDSCGGGTIDHASLIDAPPMMTNQRTCYTASVYADALRRIHEKYGLPLEVYLSTDSNLQLVDELRGLNASLLESSAAHAATTLQSLVDLYQTTASSIMQHVKSAHPLLHESTSWRILNYSRMLFQFDGVVDFVTESKKQFLVESAIQDLWHLSHGEVFVGHFSSRYGKVGYLLAVARQDSAIPYVSPDGHNLCCETDEVCSVALTKMDHMGDCLLYSHEKVFKACPDYWTKGCGDQRDSPSW